MKQKMTYELPEVVELDTAMLFKGQDTVTDERSQVSGDWGGDHDDDI